MSKKGEKPHGPGSQLLLYQAESGKLRIEVRFEGETVWLTQQDMAELFQMTKQNVGQHLKSVFAEGELVQDSVVKVSFTTAADGKNYATRVSRKASREIEPGGYDSSTTMIVTMTMMRMMIPASVTPPSLVPSPSSLESRCAFGSWIAPIAGVKQVATFDE